MGDEEGQGRGREGRGGMKGGSPQAVTREGGKTCVAGIPRDLSCS